MIRERLARGKHRLEQAAEPSLQSQPQQSDEREEWEQQLDSKIDQRVDKRGQANKKQIGVYNNSNRLAYEEKLSSMASTMTLNPWLLANQSLLP